MERIGSNDSHVFQETLINRSPAYRTALSRAEAATSSSISFATDDEDSPWAKKMILCLDGGGIRGYSSLLILKNLMTRIRELEQKPDSKAFASWDSPLIEPDRAKSKLAKFPTQEEEHADFLPCHYFDYIAGTSSGGLIAIMLGRLRMSVDHVLHEYVEVYKQILSHRHSLPVKRIVRHLRSTSLATGLESEINTLKPVQSSPEESDRGFNSDATRCRTIVCSVRSGTNKGFSIPYFYRSYPHSADRNQSRLQGADSGTTLDINSVVQATIDASKLSKSPHLNASLNNPSYEVFEEVRNLHKQFPDPIDLFLSLGCGNPKSKSSQAQKAQRPKQGGIPPSKLETHLRTVSNAVHELMLKQTDFGFGYYRLDVKERLDTVRLDEWKPKESGKGTMHRIQVATTEYLQDPEVRKMMDDCAEALVKKRRRRCETMRWEAFALGTRYRCKVESPACDLKDAKGKPVTFQDRNELLDHLRIYHHMTPPDAVNYENIKSLLDRGRTDSDSSNVSSP